MRGWLVRVLALGALGVLCFWGWHALFPSTDQLVRHRLNELAKVVSIVPNEGTLTRLSKTQKVSTFFAADAQVTLDVPGRTSQMLASREEIQNAVGYTRSLLNSLKVQFLDVDVQVNPNGQSAVANLTATANLPGEKLPEVQELNITFSKIDKEWLITKVETVKTLR